VAPPTQALISMAPHYFIVTLFALAHTSSVRQGSVFYDVSTGIYTFQEGLHSTAAAYATFVDGIFSTG
jgi:nitrate reductase assembly molybdenum cofactor insertion protein NarJ